MKNVIQAIQQQKLHPENSICAYYYDLDVLRTHLSQVMSTLPSTCQMFYAMKANSDPRILEVVSKYVHGFEVASLGEIHKARAISANIPLMFGGPGKTDVEIRGAIAQNIKFFNVESIQELQRIQLIARAMNRVVSILLRVNIGGSLPSATLQMAGRPTQFGIDELNLEAAITLATSSPYIKLHGFHFHSISNNLDYLQHLQLINYYINKVKNWIEIYKLNIDCINFGGGIGVNYFDLVQQFNWSIFASKLPHLLANTNIENTTFLFECGRFLTAFCGFYAVEVLDIKRNHGKDFVITQGGTQHFRLPVSWNHNHPLTVVPIEQWHYPFERQAVSSTEVTIVGQLCTPKDVFAKNVFVKTIRLGDVILFLYTGAYGWAISHHDFLSHPHPQKFYLEAP